MKTFRIILAATLLAVPTLRAQVVADSASLTLSNVTNSFPGDVVIGTNGSFTLLVLSDNALLGNSANGIIGLNSTAKSNEVRLISPTAYWFVETNLFIGSNGSFNRLTISNGALVENRGGFIGGFHFLSSNNEVVVTGAGSLWTNSGLSIGVVSSGNRLVITNGGRVSSGGSLLGVADPVFASNNTALITGAGSTWNNQAGLDIGYSGSSCRMVISNAAFVDNALGRIGVGATGLSASNCQAVVTGPGSVWSNRTGLHVGEFGHAARLEVTNGGAVIVLGDVLLGRPFTSTNNRIIVAGGTLRATNAAGTATLDLLRGTNQFNSGLIEADLLRMTNTLGLLEFNGGLLTTRGAFITNAPFVVGGPGNIPALWDVRAGVSNYFLSSDLYIGSNSLLNQLVITNGALLNNNAGFLGFVVGARSNLAVVAGVNSVWDNRVDLDVGFSGAANQLVVTNGGVVRNNFGILGVNSSSSNNVALVAGSGSVWTNANDVYVGRSGAGNQLLVSDGGLVRNNDGYLGVNTGSSSNLAVVTGLGSVWNNAGALFLGQDDQGNRLVVTNEGVVRSSSAFFGLNTGSSNNVAMVTGSGSRWTNTQDFYAGYSSARNQLLVTNGGTVVSSNGYLGFFSSSTNNLALVTGAGSVWSNRADVYVGNSGRANQLVASNGATVFVGGNGALGRNTGANSNAVWLTDAGTSWKIATNLYVGSNGAFNLLVVSNGALVANGSGFIGAGVSSSNNLAVVTGAGSAWTNGGPFYVGNSGSGNRLVVSNGGLVQCSSGALGLNSSSSNNEATITGAESLWTIGGNSFSLGLNGAGNRLVVSNGGRMHNGQALVGGSPNNEVLVTGAGSSWTNLTTLIMGLVLGGNRLTVSNGAVVYSAFDVQLGGNPSSTNNRIVVDGGILVAAHPTLGVLDVRRGTNVLNMGLIDVSGLLLTNALGFFELNGGTLSAGRSTIANGQLFRVGNGISPATMRLAGNGSHTFGSGLAVSANAALLGNGNLGGSLTVSNGGTFSPGLSVGKVVLSNSPSLQGTTIMEVSKDGGTLTNDQIQVIGALTYGGSLTVSKLGPDTLAAGDNFRLFVASSYAGAFSSISMPALGPELIWTNKLLVDGSIEVISILPGDHFWTNALGGFYAAPANWLLNSVPGPRDNAVFTNNAGYQVHMLGINPQNASAFFNAASGIITQALFNSSWTLTNSYIVGRDSSSTATVTHTVGFLRVTNSAGDGRLVIGGSGRGTYNLSGGDVTADSLTATNNGPGLAGSIFNFNSGNLTTLHGSTISQSDDFFIGNGSGTAAWTMSGGTNRIANGDFQFTRIGVSSGARGVVTVTGSGTEWLNSGFLLVGNVGSSNQLFIRQGGKVVSSTGYIGVNVDASDNEAWISDGDSLWTCSDAQVGAGGRNSRLVVTNGGRMLSLVAAVGTGITSSNNSVLVTGAGSVWNNQFELYLGNQGSSNSVAITSNGLVSGGSLVSVGAFADSSNNVLTVTGGNLVVTNAASDGLLQVGGGGQGTLVLNSGNVRADQLAVTNGSKSVFTFNGGTLQSGNTTVNNGSGFVVGNGVASATFELAGGTHRFANGLSVSSNGLLKGSGSVTGVVSVSGALAPGASVGQIAIAGALAFQPGSTTSFELNKAAATHDKVVGLTNLFYHGTLLVTNLAGTLANGDSFRLFEFTSRLASAFTNMILPSLDPGLKWRNKLMMDGSLQVLTIPTRDFGVDVSHFQGASGISQASWNQMFAEGKRFVFIKATEGLTGPHDGAMSNNVDRAAAAGLLAGVYHFAHPENRPTTNGAILEASNMVVYAGSAIGPGRLRPVLDIEGAATSLSTTALTDWVIAFSDEIIARRGPAAAPIIYCTQNAANFEFDSRLANYDLWLRTVGGSDPATDDPINALGFDPTGVFNEWSFWQYSDTGNSGGIAPLDLDVCHSEYKPLSSYLIPGAPPAPIQIAGLTINGGGTFQFSFTNTPGALFTVLAATNIALPLGDWTVLGPVTESPPGQFQFSDLQATNHPQRYYRVRSP